MDVFLIPTTTSDRYALYYEAPDDVVEVAAEGTGVIAWVKTKFAEMLREAEEWRHRRHEGQPEPQGMWARMRRKVMGFVVERIAEQRLLWHLRHADKVCARVPADMPESAADQVIRAMLKKDAAHHLKWMAIDFGLLILSAPLFFIPGPNVPGFYFTFQVVGHFFSLRGARNGLSAVQWTYKPSADLSELRDAMRLQPPQRQHRFHELAKRMRLEHLATFCEDVAAPSV